jgi:hypothetical protein
MISEQISKEAKVDILFENGNVVLKGILDTKGVDVELALKVESDYFLDKLAAAIPGELDDKLIGMLKLALKAI